MKFELLLLCMLAGVALGLWKETKEKIERRKTECRQQHAVEDEVLDEFELTGVLPNDYNMKCLLACFYKAEKYMNENGEISVEFARTHVPPGDNADKIVEALEKCLPVIKKGDDHCEYLYEMHQCYYKNRPNLYGGFKTYAD